MLDLIELLRLRNLPESARTKIVRHRDARISMAELRSRGWFETYQGFQSNAVFHHCDYIVSFIGMEYSRAVMTGVYRVIGHVRSEEKVPPPEYPETLRAPGGYFYNLQEVGGFEDLNDRVVIRWANARAWHQWLRPMEVMEVLPAGYAMDFPGFLEVLLTFDELAAIVAAPEANRAWHQALSAVAGIYLITDMADGSQYVGSAYGAGGILGRWHTYASSRHGGNVRLQAILENDSERYRRFQFTILQTLPLETSPAEVLRHETLHKRKLGTRAFGLNVN
jgi:hypothetical protein